MSGSRLSFAGLTIGIVLAVSSPAAAENVLRWASAGGAATADPHALDAISSWAQFVDFYEQLLQYNLNLDLVPQLAVAWRLVEPTAWEFELRPNVHFHDGTPFTAAEFVLASRATTELPWGLAGFIESIADVRAIDEHTVRIETKFPDPQLWDKARVVAIMSERWATVHDARVWWEGYSVASRQWHRPRAASPKSGSKGSQSPSFFNSPTRQRCQLARNTRARSLDALMGIRDHQLDAGEPTALELAQELDPEGLGLGGADRHAEHLAPAVGVDRDRDGHRDRDDAPGLAHLHVGRIDPEVRPVALDRPLEESPHALVDLRAQPRNLAFGDAGHAQRLDQLVDRAGRDALNIGFLDDGRERLLGDSPCL